MSTTLYFYDLETSGVNPRVSRIMQFAGQRTDMTLKPIGQPDNILVKLTDDILPDPEAILITGITPQKTIAEGITEAEFLRYFHSKVALPDTVFVGFNNVRFDDEFIRFVHYRNFYDAYEWSWQDGKSRWDMLDVVRMTRALRPDGIDWPFDSKGRPSNRLGLLTSVNSLEHNNAHDALSDVTATIAVARLIYNKQPKLFNFLLKMRDKKQVAKLVKADKPFVYTSGKFPSLYEKTSIVSNLGNHPGKQGVLVYDLRTDPDTLKGLTIAELAKRWQTRVEDETLRFPVKVLQFNRCPAVAPLEVLDEESAKRLQLNMEEVSKNQEKLKKQKDLFSRLSAALQLMDKQRQTSFVSDPVQVDLQLYDGFFDDKDRVGMSVVRAAEQDDIGNLDLEFDDQRLSGLLPLYKARNFGSSLDPSEHDEWESYRRHVLLGGGEKSWASKYFMRLSELASQKLSKEDQYLLTELQLYGESILPAPEA